MSSFLLTKENLLLYNDFSNYYRYYSKGGSLGVGKSSTQAIVFTSVLILLADLVVTQLMLY